jgi:ABC-2 type transport system permease protein
MGGLTTYATEVAAAIRVSAADRGNFLLQAAGMVVNNGFVLAMWFLFFAGFRSVGGWRLADVALLIGLIATVVGAAGVLCGGYRDLAAAILRGDPDGALTQPKAVLARLLARESNITGWGDLVTGAALLGAFAALTPAQLPGLALALTCGFAVYVSTAVLFACMAFWIRGARSFARDLTDFVIMFSSWPGSVYSGATKLIVYTVFPAGFIVLLPVSLLREPSLATALTVAAAAAAYAWLALTAFDLGLRRYRQGEAPSLSTS